MSSLAKACPHNVLHSSSIYWYIYSCIYQYILYIYLHLPEFQEYYNGLLLMVIFVTNVVFYTQWTYITGPVLACQSQIIFSHLFHVCHHLRCKCFSSSEMLVFIAAV